MTKDSRKDQSSEKPKRKKLFSIRNIIVLLLVVAVAAVVGNKLGLLDRLPFIGTKTAPVAHPAAETPEGAQPAASEPEAAPSGAGSLMIADVMNRHFVAVRESDTAEHAVEMLKNRENAPQVVFVIDAQGRLVGACSPAKLLVAPQGERVGDLMEREVEAVEASAGVNTVRKTLELADGAPVPVVNKAGILIGAVSAADLGSRAMAKAGEHSGQAAGMHVSAAPVHEGKKPAAAMHAAPEDEGHAVKTAEAAPAATGGEGHAEESAAGTHATAGQQHTAAAGAHGASQAQHATPAEKMQGHQQPEGGGHGASAETAAHGTAAAGAAHAAAAAADAHGTAPASNLPRGVAFVNAMIQPLQYELEDRWWGWRPNDILDFTDNVNNFQLGVLEATRRAAVALAERISRTGTIEAFDVNVQNAMNWLMVKSDRYWLPSPEYKYKAAIEELEKYRDRLMRGEASFYTRQDNLIPLLVAFKDLLGSCEENLVKPREEDGSPVSYFKADDYFYYAQGVVSAMGSMLEAVAIDFHDTIQGRRGSEELHHAIHWYQEAMKIDPWLVLDSSYSSIFANHRANLAGPISHLRFHLGVLITTLST